MDYNEIPPELNNMPPQNNIPTQNNSSNGYAIASLVLGILSIPMGCCYGFGIILSILSIIFGILSKKNNYGKIPGMSIAGIICSVIGILCSIFMIICLIAAFNTPEWQTYFRDIIDESQNRSY